MINSLSTKIAVRPHSNAKCSKFPMTESCKRVDKNLHSHIALMKVLQSHQAVSLQVTFVSGIIATSFTLILNVQMMLWYLSKHFT